MDFLSAPHCDTMFVSFRWREEEEMMRKEAAKSKEVVALSGHTGAVQMHKLVGLAASCVITRECI